MSLLSDQFVFVGAARGAGGPEGIYIFRLDAATGKLTPLGEVLDIQNPSFFALHPSGEILYAIDEDRSETPSRGHVRSYAVDRRSGALRLINRQPTRSHGLCHLSTDLSGRFLFATHYGGGVVSVLPIADDGSLEPPSDVIHHQGAGPHARQDAPHPHSAFVDPTGRFVLVPDLGLDRVMVYRLNKEAGRLEPNDPPWAELLPASGPRHLAFHPSGAYVYVINELASTVTVFSYDGEAGRLTLLQTVTTLPDEYAGKDENTTAEILVHPTGRFVYGSNRGHDSIVIYGVATDGRLRLLGHEPTQGSHPRNFALDPTGTYLFAENRDSNTIVTFRIDGDSGLLQPTGEVTEVPRPVCIKMVPIER